MATTCLSVHRNRRVEDKLTSDNSTILPGSISIAIGLFMPSDRCANRGSVRIVGVGGSTRLAEGNQQTVRLTEPLGCQAAITVGGVFQ